MLKILSLAGGVAGAVTLSQYPEFSQQYLQRLAGQVDALTVVVVDFDASALASDLGREEALAQMTGTAFLADRQADMRRTFGRHARLMDNLASLRAATPMQRLTMPHRLGDRETLSATWADFAPAVPTNTAGIAAAGAGFFGGWVVLGGLFAALTMPFRRMAARLRKRREERATADVRQDPPMMRPPRPTLVLEAPSHRPVMGETR